MLFETKIALVVREDLEFWQKLNVTAFLTSGIVGASPEIIGEPYRDAADNTYHRLSIQPVMVLAADAGRMRTIYDRAMRRGIAFALYTEEMFSTGHDATNRAAVRALAPEALNLVGLGFREDRKLVDKITKGAKLHD